MLVLIACAVVLAIPNRYGLWRVDFLIAVASAALVGALVASRQPRNPVGWFILGHALCFSLGEFGRQYAIYGILTKPGALPFARAMISGRRTGFGTLASPSMEFRIYNTCLQVSRRA